MKILMLALVLGISSSVMAISERDVLTDMVRVLDTQKNSFYTFGHFKTRVGLARNSSTPDLKISYTKYGTQKGARGSLVIVPGRTESSLKYIEVATDFINQGYSPVYALDHRGQGFSPTVTSKELPDPTTIGHVEVFDHYTQDFEQFVNVVIKDPAVDTKNLYLISNSMGGTIAMRYFQKNPNNPFKKAALSGSMFKIITNESFPLLRVSVVCKAGFIAPIVTKLKCYDYTPGESSFKWVETEYLPDGRKIEVRKFEPNGDRTLTSSHARFRLNDYIWNKWPQTIVGGPSLKWTEQALTETQRLRQVRELKKVKTPLFILIADRDFRADANAQLNVCRRVGGSCIAKNYDAYHEIFMETDSIRNEALNDIFTYFQN